MKNAGNPSEKLYSGDYHFLEGKREIILMREGGANFLYVPRGLEEEINKRWSAFIQRQDERGLYTEDGDIMCTSPSYWFNGTGIYFVIACPSKFKKFSVTRPKFRQKGPEKTSLDEMKMYRLGSASMCKVEIIGSDYVPLRSEIVNGERFLYVEVQGFTKPGDLRRDLKNSKPPRYTLERAGREKIAAPYEMEESGVMMSDESRNVISCFDARMRARDIESEFLMRDGRGYERDSILLESKRPSGGREKLFLYPLENLGDFVLKNGKYFEQKSAKLLKRYFERL